MKYLGAINYKFQRFIEPSEIIDGYNEDSETEILFIKGSLQPMTANEIKIYELGEQSSELLVFYTDKRLNGALPSEKSDILLLDDGANTKKYRVLKIEDWTLFENAGIYHYKIILQLKTRD